MSVLIKGMEMPKKIEPGLVVEFAEGIDGKRYARLHHYRYGALTDWLEAIPVTEHGRLIDADAMIIDLMDRGIEGVQTDDWHEIQQVVMDAPIIIQASEEGKE